MDLGNYGKEPVDMRLFAIYLTKKIWMVILAALLGALLVGGPYYLRKVTFGPAKEYAAVTDFYIDYAKGENGEEYVYFNQTTWTQLIGDDVFTEDILRTMNDSGITKDFLKNALYATMLSDTRIVTTTVTTNDPELTIRINSALVEAMQNFAEEQKEIADVRILNLPEEASLVKADVRTFRACMLGAVIFVFCVCLYLILYFVLDDHVYVPITLCRRYGLADIRVSYEKNFSEASSITDDTVVIRCGDKEIADLSGKKVLLAIEAGKDNGKVIEETLYRIDHAKAAGVTAVLFSADEKLQKLYYAPEHLFQRKKK